MFAPTSADRTDRLPSDAAPHSFWQTRATLAHATAWAEVADRRDYWLRAVGALDTREAWAASGAEGPDPFPLVSAYQRERLLQAVTTHAVRGVVEEASGLPPFRLALTADADLSPWSPETFLASRVRAEPGARLDRASLYRLYVAQVPPGHEPVPAQRFHAVVVRTLSPTQHRVRGYPTWGGIALNPAVVPLGARTA